MGIFRDLVSNVANARQKEEQQKAAFNQGLGDILTALIQNPSTDPGTFAKASAYYTDLLGKHGGKEGRNLQNQISQFLNAYGQQRAMSRAVQQGGFDPNAPPGTPQVQPQGPIATPASLTSAAPPPAQPTRGGFRGALRSLAGVGGEMVGIPRTTAPETPSKQQIAAMYGPTEVEQAEQKERGSLAAQNMERQQFFRQQDEDVKAGLQTADQAMEAKAAYDREMKPPGSRAATRIPVGDQVFEIALQARADQKAKLLGHPVQVSDLTHQEQLEAFQDTKPLSEGKAEDRDAMLAYADELSQNNPDRVAKLGHSITPDDMSGAERMDARMAWAKRKAMRGEEMPSDEQLRAMVNYDLLTGKTTAMGMSASDPFRRAYQNMRGKILAERGVGSVAERAAAFRADSGSLNLLQRQTDAMDGWEANAKKNLDQARQLSRQVGRTGSSLANEYLQYLQGKLEDYPLLAQFRVAVETGSAEYTKVMYSATPTGGTAKDQRDASRTMLSTGMADGTINGAIEQMYIDMDNRQESMHNQIDTVKYRMGTGATGPETGGAGGAGAAATGGLPPMITNADDYNALPSGTTYRKVGKDGQIHTYKKK